MEVWRNVIMDVWGMEVWENGIPKVCGKWYVGMEIMGELNYESMWEWNYGSMCEWNYIHNSVPHTCIIPSLHTPFSILILPYYHKVTSSSGRPGCSGSSREGGASCGSREGSRDGSCDTASPSSLSV